MSEIHKDKEAKADCYSAGERGWMEFGQKIRAIILAPMLRWLTRVRVSPDAVTLMAGVMGLLFVPFWLQGYPSAALSCLLLHVLLDGLDGPLARYQKIASSQGSFTDTFTDQLVVTAVMIAWMVAAPSSWNIFAGSAYVFLYALVVAMAMVRNALSVPYAWLIRPRFMIYVSLATDAWFDMNATLVVLLVCNLLLAIKSLSGFFKLRRELPGPAGR